MLQHIGCSESLQGGNPSAKDAGAQRYGQ